jgi:hypothetical protein
MRMSNDRDQDFVRAAIFDTAASLLDFLPSMGPREAIVFGDGVTLPGRIRFADLPEHAMPRSRTTSFTENWQQDNSGPINLAEVVERWRAADAPKLQTGVTANDSAMHTGGEVQTSTPPLNAPPRPAPQRNAQTLNPPPLNPPPLHQPQQVQSQRPKLQNPLGSRQRQLPDPGMPNYGPGQFSRR